MTETKIIERAKIIRLTQACKSGKMVAKELELDSATIHQVGQALQVANNHSPHI
jgi:hypothetical protein